MSSVLLKPAKANNSSGCPLISEINRRIKNTDFSSFEEIGELKKYLAEKQKKSGEVLKKLDRFIELQERYTKEREESIEKSNMTLDEITAMFETLVPILDERGITFRELKRRTKLTKEGLLYIGVADDMNQIMEENEAAIEGIEETLFKIDAIFLDPLNDAIDSLLAEWAGYLKSAIPSIEGQIRHLSEQKERLEGKITSRESEVREALMTGYRDAYKKACDLYAQKQTEYGEVISRHQNLFSNMWALLNAGHTYGNIEAMFLWDRTDDRKAKEKLDFFSKGAKAKYKDIHEAMNQVRKEGKKEASIEEFKKIYHAAKADLKYLRKMETAYAELSKAEETTRTYINNGFRMQDPSIAPKYRASERITKEIGKMENKVGKNKFWLNEINSYHERTSGKNN